MYTHHFFFFPRCTTPSSSSIGEGEGELESPARSGTDTESAGMESKGVDLFGAIGHLLVTI